MRDGLSRQRLWQLKLRAEGRCIQCGRQALLSTRAGQTFKRYCEECGQKRNDQQRVKNRETQRVINNSKTLR